MYTIHSILFCTTNESRWLPLFHWGGWLVFSLGPCVARLIPHFGQFPRNTAHTHAQLEGETHRWGLHRERTKKKNVKFCRWKHLRFTWLCRPLPPFFRPCTSNNSKGGKRYGFTPKLHKFFPILSLFFFVPASTR